MFLQQNNVIRFYKTYKYEVQKITKYHVGYLEGDYVS